MTHSLNKLFDDEKLPINCPVCSHNFNVKLREMTKDGSIVQCPACKTDIELQHDTTTKKTLRDIEKATKKFEKSLNDLEKAFKKFGR
jgi:transposase-like protein